MRKHFVIWCARSIGIGGFFAASVLSADSVAFKGTLVRKYYQHLIPNAVELNVFGWFLELDSFSKIYLQEKIATLSEEDRQSCAKFEFDSSFVQLCLSGEEDRLLCRSLEGSRVEALGEWPSSPHIYRPIPSYQLHLTEIKQILEDMVSLNGTLHFKVFPGPPNYDCVEDGDYPEGCWVLKLDNRSKDVLAAPMSLSCSSKGDEITIEVDRQFKETLEQYANAQVTCVGNVHYAETAHHHTPLLLRSCKIALNKSP